MNFSSEKELDPLDLPAFLAAQDLFPKLYWKCRKTGKEVACLGALLELHEIPENPTEKFYGALAFPGPSKESLWKDFPSPYFFLPQVEIEQTPLKTVIRTRIPFTPNPPLKEILDCTSLGDPLHVPDQFLWEKSIQKVLDSNVEKVVLARRSSFESSHHPYSWIKKLLKSSQNSTVFAFERKSSSLFLGASPEMLYEREGNKIKTESIAGTRKKTDSSSDFLKSCKDKKEVSFVKDFLKEKLSSLCKTYSFDDLDSLIETSHLKHLYNRFEGTLKEGISDFDLLSSLHPTPAIGGFPQKQALEEITSLESFDRGLYAGALGWISPLESSFAVTIRSALIQEGFLHAFAGAGILDGSDPSKEWNELNDKLAHWKTS